MLLALVFSVVAYRLDESLRQVLLWQIRTKTSMRGTIESLHLDLPKRELTIGKIRLTDPKQGDREVGRIDSLTATVRSNDLLYRRHRLQGLDISGIEIAIGSEQDGFFTPDPLWAELQKNLSGWKPPMGGASIALLFGDNSEETVNRLLDQFQTAKVARELKDRWPQEAQQLRARAANIESHFKQLQEIGSSVSNASDKPAAVRQILERLAAIEEEILQAEGEVQNIRQRGEGDIQKLKLATQQDNQQLQTLRGPKLDPAELSEKLLGETIRKPYEQLLVWIEWVRSLMEPEILDEIRKNQDGDDAAKERNGNRMSGIRELFQKRGRDILFVGMEKNPELQIDTVTTNGLIRLGKSPVHFIGTIHDVVHPQTSGMKPIIARFCFSGIRIPETPVLSEELQRRLLAECGERGYGPETIPDIFVTLEVDRTQNTGKDRVEIRCPIYVLPEMTLGNRDDFALALSPGYATLEAIIELQTDSNTQPASREDAALSLRNGLQTSPIRRTPINGQIRLTQHNVSAELLLPAQLQETPAGRGIRESLLGIKTITTDLMISGTREEPVYTVRSTLGEQLSRVVETALASQWGQTRHQLEESLNKEIGESAQLINMVTQDLGPNLIKQLLGQQQGFEKQLLGNSAVESLLESQMSQLSEKDRARVQGIFNHPGVQKALGGQGETKDLEKAIPGLLNRLLPK